MILSVLTLQPAPGRVGDVLAYYRSAGILEASGAVAAQLLVAEDDPGTVVVTALWADGDAYTAWEDAPVRQEFTEALAPMFDGAGGASSRRFRVVHRTGPAV